MARFSPPAFEQHDDAIAAAWDKRVRGWVTAAREADGHRANSLVDIVGTENDGWTLRDVPWNGFPISLRRWYEDKPNPDASAEDAAGQTEALILGYRRHGAGYEPEVRQYRLHDEYCEFFEEYDDASNLASVTFTCEHADYWQFLAEQDLDLVLGLYQAKFGAHVTRDELVWPYDVYRPDPNVDGGWAVAFAAGSYNPWNKWNTEKGAVHSTHPSNTLLKAINLVVGSSVLRKHGDDTDITDVQELICASGFGDPNRASDAAVGGAVNARVLAREQIAISEAPAVYISELGTAGLSAAGGEDVTGIWRVERGDADGQMILHAVFDPSAAGLSWDQIRLDGAPIANGAQLARLVRLHATVATRERPADVEEPERQPVVGACLAHPRHPAYLGVFLDGESWPDPPGEPSDRVSIDGTPPLGTRRWSLDQRRWSLLWRWS